MEDAVLIARARLAIGAATSGLLAAERAEWKGIAGDAYRVRLSDAAARIAALGLQLESAAVARGMGPWVMER